MSRRLCTTIFPLLLLAVSFSFCQGKRLSDAGDETLNGNLPEATIEHLGDCSNEPEVKDVCDEVCGENSCRNRLTEKSLLPVQHFCFCHEELPQNGSIFDCGPETENATLRDECQQTCANLFDPEGNEYSDYYCYSQDEDEKKDEDCICVASSAKEQEDDYNSPSDLDSVIQNPRGKKPKPGKRPPTNGASCSNIDGGNQNAISCQVGTCFANCPGGQLGSSIPGPLGNGNGNSDGQGGAFDGNSVVIGK